MTPRCAVCDEPAHLWAIVFAPDALCGRCYAWSLRLWWEMTP
jgi:hypothetical protein